MDWMAALRARGTGDVTLAALVSSRVDWVHRKQGDRLPGLTLMMAADERPQHLKGYDLQASRVQLDAWGSSHKEAWAVMDAAIDAFVPGGTFNGHLFSRAMIDLPARDMTERSGSETVFRVSADLTFRHVAVEAAS